MLMFPFNTLKNWGSSSKLDRRKNVPNLVRRGSFDVVHPVSDCSEQSTFIVRNLYIRNALPFRPTRYCTNKTGPGDVSLIAIAITIIKGEASRRIMHEKITSKTSFCTR
jgi:hypothetical protein